MRTESEMLELILNTAKENDLIRAVYMNGSRANPNVAKDNLRDYDIVYVVSEMEWFMNHKDWISVFGEPAVIQEPDKNDAASGGNRNIFRRYVWLMLFKDGNRIDLTIELLRDDYWHDSLTVLLLDKDGILPPSPEAYDTDYHVKKPNKARYKSVCNNFWWCLQNVAKGIARDQLTYAMNMYVQVVHAELEIMIEWYIGARNNFSTIVGMWGKYFKKYLPEDIYKLYEKTYSDADYENLWKAIDAACKLFRLLGNTVGEMLNYEYNLQEDKNMTEYLTKIKNRKERLAN